MAPEKMSVWIGYDPREMMAFNVARESCRHLMTMPIPIYGLMLADLIKMGLYTRPIEFRPSAADKPIMWDVVSDAPMSTQHSNARFFVPMLAKTGWALFTDGDVLFRGNVCRLFEQLSPDKAIYCVHQNHVATNASKMDGQIQTNYARKNWSSVIAFNCDHPANAALTLDFLNTTPGRDLHRFCWLDDSLIGELAPAWNYLVGHTDPSVAATIVHFTDGVPDMPGYEDVRYAEDWRMVRDSFIRGVPYYNMIGIE